jgi:hypothetical protein
MKPRKIVAIVIGILIIATVVTVFVWSALTFTLEEKDLQEDTLKRVTELYQADIADYTLLDSNYSNNTRNFLYKLRLETGAEKIYAVSYSRHLLFPRYRFDSYTDGSRPDSGILLTYGMPYYVAYDITGNSLRPKDSTLNGRLASFISVASVVAVTVLIYCLLRIWLGRREGNNYT